MQAALGIDLIANPYQATVIQTQANVYQLLGSKEFEDILLAKLDPDEGQEDE